MSIPTGHQLGGRGCPKCGSHNTEGFNRNSAQWCHDCDHRWAPCRPGCRGYRLEVDPGKQPVIRGCADCGVPDKIAWHWPEAWRAMANRLGDKRLEPVVAV